MEGAYPSEDLLYDEPSRRAKGAKILAVLRDYVGDNLSNLLCLDVGCASGLITKEIAPCMGYTVGIEYSAAAVGRVTQPPTESRLAFLRGDAMALPIGDETMDIVVCAQVYEHVPDDERLAQEIWRVLRPGGICFFSGPNRLDPIERHYGLPFVSWLPRSLADALIRWTGKGDRYGEHPRTLWGLRALWKAFEIHDYSLAVLQEPERFHTSAAIGAMGWVGRLPHCLLRMLYPLVINYNWLLVKTYRSPAPGGKS